MNRKKTKAVRPTLSTHTEPGEALKNPELADPTSPRPSPDQSLRLLRRGGDAEIALTLPSPDRSLRLAGRGGDARDADGPVADDSTDTPIAQARLSKFRTDPYPPLPTTGEALANPEAAEPTSPRPSPDQSLRLLRRGGDARDADESAIEKSVLIPNTQYPIPIRTPIRLRWESEFWFWHSIAGVNREAVIRLARRAGIELSIAPTGPRQFGPEVDPRFRILDDLSFATLSGPADFHLRHFYPPRLNGAIEGKLIIMLAWEYGNLPIRWIPEMLANVALFFCYSEAIRQTYIASGIPPERLVVIPLGADTDVFRPDGPKHVFTTEVGASRLAAFDEPPFVFLFCGGAMDRKGVDIIEKAMLYTFAPGEPVCCVIKDFCSKTVYRGGTYSDRFRALASDVTRPLFIYMDEDMTPWELAALYRFADIMLLPARAEGFCLPAIEGMSSGKAVICTQGTPMARAATDDYVDETVGYPVRGVRTPYGNRVIGDLACCGETWWLEVDPKALGKRMREAYNNRDEVRKRGAAAARRVRENYTWDHMVDRMVTEFEKLRVGEGESGGVGEKDGETGGRGDGETMRGGERASGGVGEKDGETGGRGDGEKIRRGAGESGGVGDSDGETGGRGDGETMRGGERGSGGVGDSDGETGGRGGGEKIRRGAGESGGVGDSDGETGGRGDGETMRGGERGSGGVGEKDGEKIGDELAGEQSVLTPKTEDLTPKLVLTAFDIVDKRSGAKATAIRPKAYRRKRPFITLCMIVKQEGKNIGNCVQSVIDADCVDAICITDTGSTDNTVAICKGFGKIVRVSYCPWNDSFSFSRNYSFDQAPPQTEWRIWVDADDILPKQCGAMIRESVLLAEAKTMGILMQVHIPPRPGEYGYTVVDHCKIIRAGSWGGQPEFRFESRIHEQIMDPITRHGWNVERSEAYVVHAGYDYSPEGQASKHEREVKLLAMDEEERPDHPMPKWNIAMTAFHHNDFPQAVEKLQQCLALSQPQESTVHKCYAMMGAAYWEMGDREKAREYLDLGLAMFPYDTEILFRSAGMYRDLGDLAAAERLYLRLLAPRGTTGVDSLDVTMGSYKGQFNLGSVYVAMQRYSDAERCYQIALQQCPPFVPAWQMLGLTYVQMRRFDDAREVQRKLAEYSADAAAALGKDIGRG